MECRRVYFNKQTGVFHTGSQQCDEKEMTEMCIRDRTNSVTWFNFSSTSSCCSEKVMSVTLSSPKVLRHLSFSKDVYKRQLLHCGLEIARRRISNPRPDIGG